MLKWCSNCQQFMGEVPDFESLALSHGICGKCHPQTADLSDRAFDHAIVLRGIYRELSAAGRNDDMVAARRVLDEAVEANCRPVDILMGIMAPMLYQVGEDWSRGIRTVEDERRFTSFCEKTFELVVTRLQIQPLEASITAPTGQYLLINAPGNTHTLAIRILALWLISHGMPARIAGPFADLDELVELVTSTLPKTILVSIALPDQSDGVCAIVTRMEQLPDAIRPRVIVGGDAVKRGLVSPIPGAHLMADINALVGPQIQAAPEGARQPAQGAH